LDNTAFFQFVICVFHALVPCGMKTNSFENTDPRWQKTPVANLVRHVQSGNEYARIRVRGKLIWKFLKTDRISVAKLLLLKQIVALLTGSLADNQQESHRRDSRINQPIKHGVVEQIYRQAQAVCRR